MHRALVGSNSATFTRSVIPFFIHHLSVIHFSLSRITSTLDGNITLMGLLRINSIESSDVHVHQHPRSADSIFPVQSNFLGMAVAGRVLLPASTWRVIKDPLHLLGLY